MSKLPTVEGDVKVPKDAEPILTIGNHPESALLVSGHDERKVFDLRRDGFAIGDKASKWKVVKALFQRKGYGIAGA